MKSWTNKVDIFTKDFLVIPINEKYSFSYLMTSFHWYMAIVVNPKVLVAQEPHFPASDSDSIKSVLGAAEYDSIDSCSSTGGEPQTAQPSNLILSSDEVLVQSSKVSDSKYSEKGFADAVRAEEKYLAQIGR